jgi:plasmid stabilization system protein ParE
MAFRVEIGNLDAIADHIQRHGSFESAQRWFNGIVMSIRSLGEMPSRCRLAAESEDLQTEVRLLLHGKRNRRYKIYFAIHCESATVRVFHIRHWPRKAAEKSELEELKK